MVNRGNIGKLPGGGGKGGELPWGQRGQTFAQGGNAPSAIVRTPLISDMMKTVLQSCQFNTMCLTSALGSRRMNVIYSLKLCLLN